MKKFNFKLWILIFVWHALSVGAKQKPNILIYTDQQHANMMSCANNPYVKTPAMDYMAENGIRFTRAYTTNPVCVAARISMMTGRFPSAFRDKKGNLVRENIGGYKQFGGASEEIIKTLLPTYIKQAGYDLLYGGKIHLPAALTPDKHGLMFMKRIKKCS